MPNLYALSKDELLSLCKDKLFDKKETKILLCIIYYDKPIKEIASILGVSEATVNKKIREIKNKLQINKWTDSIL